MAGKRTGFITGANAKLKIGNDTLAYVNDVSYQIETGAVPVESFGTFEVFANEPISYSVRGSFSILRFTKNAATAANAFVNPNMPVDSVPGIAAIGNGADKFLNPAMMLLAVTFDLALSQKHSNAAGSAGASTEFLKIMDCKITGRRAQLSKRGVLIDQYTFVGIMATDSDAAVQNSPSGNDDLK